MRPGAGGDRLVVLLQNLVDLGELGGAADGGHGDGSLRSMDQVRTFQAGRSAACFGGSSSVGSGAVVGLFRGQHLLQDLATAIDRLTP